MIFLRPRSRAGLPLLVACAILLTAGACNRGQEQSAANTAGRPVRVECPLTSDTIVVDSTYVPAHAVTVIPVAGQITHVPEFHDCQRLIDGGDKQALKYDSLVAIFAAKDIVSLAQKQHQRRTGGRPLPATGSQEPHFPQPVADTSDGLSFAELYSWGGTFPALGIGPGFNCLYLVTISGHQHSFMVTVKHEDDCLFSLYDLGRLHSSEIVHAREIPLRSSGFVSTSGMAFPQGDIPPVARWDWDPIRKEQFIGIRCGSEWCNIGPTAATAPAIPDPGPFDAVPGYAASTGEIGRVWQVKGWQDYQQLVTKDAAGKPVPGNGGWLVPNPVLGRIVVDAGTGESVFHNRWVHVATAFMTGPYDNGVLHLVTGPNKIYVCEGTGCPGVTGPSTPACPGMSGAWWTVTGVTPSGANARPICRHEVTGYDPPGTARWRWLAGDETTWTRCLQGCCQQQ